MDDIYKKLRELEDKATRYDNQKKRYTELSEQLNQAMDILKAVVKELDPYTSMKPRTKKKHDEVVEELYRLLLGGTEVTTNLVMKTYQLDARLAAYIMAKLAKSPEIDFRKEGRIKFLFAKRTL